MTSKIFSRRFHNPVMKLIATLADSIKKEEQTNNIYKSILIRTYNLFLPILKIIFSDWAVENLIELDDYISNMLPSYSGIIFVLLKDVNCYSSHQIQKISIPQIINFTVPWHYIRET